MLYIVLRYKGKTIYYLIQDFLLQKSKSYP